MFPAGSTTSISFGLEQNIVEYLDAEQHTVSVSPDTHPIFYRAH